MNKHVGSDGKTYIAIEAIDGNCDGCDFYNHYKCGDAPDCSAHRRTDNRHVIWKIAIPQPEAVTDDQLLNLLSTSDIAITGDGNDHWYGTSEDMLRLMRAVEQLSQQHKSNN